MSTFNSFDEETTDGGIVDTSNMSFQKAVGTYIRVTWANLKALILAHVQTNFSQSVIKTKYEANSDTNAYTDAEKTKVGYLTVTQAVDLDAIETRVNALDAAVVLVGSWDASSGTFPGGGTAQAGESYLVTGTGTVDSVVFTAGDRIIALTDNASTSTYSGNWYKADYTDVYQTDSQIETAYNNQVSTVSQAEAEAGTSTTVRRWTAERVKQAIVALATSFWTNGGNSTGNTKYGVKTVEIGTWNMDALSSKAVAHGLTMSNIRVISVMIRNDDGTIMSELNYSAGAGLNGYWNIGSTNITLNRIDSGDFDTTSYDNTTGFYNRGWITIFYEIA